MASLKGLNSREQKWRVYSEHSLRALIEQLLLRSIERDTLNKLFTAEQKFYRQRSRVRRADVGDRNMTFYHKTVNQRVTQNHIHYLQDEDNNFFGTTSAIKEHSVAYFQ